MFTLLHLNVASVNAMLSILRGNLTTAIATQNIVLWFFQMAIDVFMLVSLADVTKWACNQ